ncbi:nucleotide exchange factor GrpE [Kitasatospora indigofera]|uniref:nucleotide exchange factor GrpE n=1 Tax=Kitasatospora indigofera TaxID=67307 RepID=UPI00363FFE80
MTGTDTGRPAPDLPGARLPADGLTAAQLPAAQLPGPQIPGARLPAGPDPLAIDEQPLPVPPGAAAVDLADAFGKLLFRSAFAQRKRAEEAKEAESGLRDLLLGLLEVDDALGAIAGPELQPAPYPERLLGAPALATAQAQAGVAATRRLLRLKLARAGVRPMSFDNRLANTAVSEIVATTPVAGMPEDTVVEVVQAGFFWQDQVLRRARVVVSVLPEELPEEPSEELPEELSEEPSEELPEELSEEPAPEPVPESEPEPEPSPEAVATERPRPVRKQPKRQPSRAKRRTTAGVGAVGAGSGAGPATAGTVAGTTGEASTDTVTTDTVTNDSTITDSTITDTGSTGTGNTGG